MSVPTTRPARTSLQPAKNNQDFKNQTYQILAKFGDNSTLKYAQDEMRELMAEQITDSERMNIFINLISDVNEHMKPLQKKEHLRIFGQLGELFGENIIPFMPKIIQFYQKKFKDIDPQLSQALADSLGVLYHFMLKNLENKEEGVDQLKIILRELHSNIIQPAKQQQITASICLAKVIQNSPASCLKKILPKIANRMYEQINSPNTKCRAQILECLISIVLSIEKDFHPYVKNFLPFILEGAQSKDQETKKMAIDVIYTVAAILPPALSPYKDHFVEVLNESRFDKQKPIREATIEAISALKDLPPVKQERVQRTDGPDKKGAREDPTPRPREMPSEKFDIQADKKGAGGRQSPTGQGKQVTAVTQKKLMNARIMKSKSPVRKELLQQRRDQDQPKTSIFKGPVNQEFFKKVEKIENGIEIVIAPGQDTDEEENDNEQNDSKIKDETSPKNETQDIQETDYQQTKYIEEDDEQNNQNYLSTQNKRDSINVSRKISEAAGQKNATQSFNMKDTSFRRQGSKGKMDVTDIYNEHNNLQVSRVGRVSNIQRGSTSAVQTQNIQNFNISPLSPGGLSLMNPPTYSYPNMQSPQLDDDTSANQGIDNTSFNNSLNYIFYELDKISNQQLRMMESMNSFQNFTRNEIDYLKSKISTIESSVDELMRQNPGFEEGGYGRDTFGSPGPQKPYYNNYTNLTTSYQPRDFVSGYNDLTGGGYQSFRNTVGMSYNPNNSMLQNSMVKPINNYLNTSRETFGNRPLNINPQTYDWNRIQSLVNDGNLNEAYSQVLIKSRDEMQLIKLMGKTGVCIDQLQKTVLDFLVNKMIELISKKDFLNVIQVWIQDLSRKLIEDQYILNYNTTVNFIEALKRLCEDFSQNVPQQVRQVAKQAHESLSQSFKFY